MYSTLKRQGFTIVELTTVIAIIAILATITVASYRGVQKQSRDSKRANDMKIMSAALENYYDKNGEYPSGCNAGCYIDSSFSPGDTNQISDDTTVDTLRQTLSGVSADFGDPLGDPGSPFMATSTSKGYLYYGQYDLNTGPGSGSSTTLIGPAYTWISCGAGTPGIGFSLQGGGDPEIGSNTYVLAYQAEESGKWYISQGQHGSHLTGDVSGTTVGNCIFLP
ncbi:MAG: prepilin-type N-terminal cleavage/methylation domain-containing protein [Candidatus Saccharimonas sp.]